jgi:hypothetical protein
LAHHRGTEGRRVSSSISDTSHTALEELYVEVEEETGAKTGKLKVGQDLRPMDLVEMFHGFYFDHYPPSDSHVQPNTCFELKPLVINRHQYLSLDHQPS